MNENELELIDRLVHSQVGRDADCERYNRSTQTPMNFTLDRAEKELGRSVAVYWVRGGPPENFSLPGFEPTPVVFSERQLEMAAFLRKFLVHEDVLKNVRVEFAERACLRVIAELALRHGNADLATLAFLKSTVEQNIIVPLDNGLMMMEDEPIRESYMAMWFFGLAHEIGHSQVLDDARFAEGLLSDASLEGLVDSNLAGYASVPEQFKQAAKAEARRHKADHPLGVVHLRGEATADIFAASVILRATIEILTEMGAEFRFFQYVAEMYLSLNIVSLMERCKAIAQMASMDRTIEDRTRVVFHPVTFQVRMVAMVNYLQYLAALQVSAGGQPTEEETKLASGQIEEIFESMRPAIEDAETGLSRAMQFMLIPEERDPELFEKFVAEATTQKLPWSRMEAPKFLALAASLGVESTFLTRLRRIVGLIENRKQPGELRRREYVVPWVEGPHGFSKPFGLNTRYGYLIFVFQSEHDGYRKFCRTSAELPDSFSVKTAALVVDEHPIVGYELAQEQIGRVLALQISADTAFQVVVEGTAEFEERILELAV